MILAVPSALVGYCAWIKYNPCMHTKCFSVLFRTVMC